MAYLCRKLILSNKKKTKYRHIQLNRLKNIMLVKEAMVWEDSICRGATEPLCLESLLINKRSRCNENPIHHS